VRKQGKKKRAPKKNKNATIQTREKQRRRPHAACGKNKQKDPIWGVREDNLERREKGHGPSGTPARPPKTTTKENVCLGRKPRRQPRSGKRMRHRSASHFKLLQRKKRGARVGEQTPPGAMKKEGTKSGTPERWGTRCVAELENGTAKQTRGHRPKGKTRKQQESHEECVVR